jgi:hypothetical protein
VQHNSELGKRSNVGVEKRSWQVGWDWRKV